MSNKVFLDTNVVVDLLGERQMFYESAAKIASLADKKIIQIVVSSLTYATAYYLLCKFESSKIVREKVIKFKTIAETSDLTNKSIDLSLASSFSDFEDALQYYCAIEANCNVLVTRNIKDFGSSQIAVLTPDEYLLALKS